MPTAWLNTRKLVMLGWSLDVLGGALAMRERWGEWLKGFPFVTGEGDNITGQRGTTGNTLGREVVL